MFRLISLFIYTMFQPHTIWSSSSVVFLNVAESCSVLWQLHSYHKRHIRFFVRLFYRVSSPDLSNDHLILNSLTSFVPCLRKSKLIVYIFLINIQTLLMTVRNVYIVIFFRFLFVLAIILISLHSNLYITFFSPRMVNYNTFLSVSTC